MYSDQRNVTKTGKIMVKLSEMPSNLRTLGRSKSAEVQVLVWLTAATPLFGRSQTRVAALFLPHDEMSASSEYNYICMSYLLRSGQITDPDLIDLRWLERSFPKQVSRSAVHALR